MEMAGDSRAAGQATEEFIKERLTVSGVLLESPTEDGNLLAGNARLNNVPFTV